MSDKKIVDMLLDIDTKILYSILIVLTLIALLVSPGIGLVKSERLGDFYDIIENLPSGSIIFFDNSLSAGREADMTAVFPAWVHIWKQDVKIVIVHFDADAPMVTNMLFDRMPQRIRDMKEYGTDWVMFGYAPGEETAQVAVANNIRGVFSTDFFDTPIDELPMMKNIYGTKDADLVLLQVVSLDFIESAVRQYGSTFGLPILFPASVGRVPYLQPYYPNLIKGYVTEIDAAVYEYLVGVPGNAVKLSDVRALSTIYAVVLLIGVNILTYVKGEKR